ncbi:vesicular transport protein, partial [Chrysochromulina tobinii]
MSKLDPRLPHRVQEWASTQPNAFVSERDADAIVAWLRAQRGSDYARKPVDGLRKQVVRVIGQLRAPPKASTPGTPEWSIDASPDTAAANSTAGSGSKRSLEAASAAAGMVPHLASASKVRELVEYPLTHPEIYAHLGVEPPRGLLLHGPPGCGKTLLACSIAAELGCAFLRISAPEVVSGMSGESEAKIRQLFQEAATLAPALIFIDEIDAIAPKRETAQREMERRIVAQLLTCMDELSFAATGGQTVIVMGATNRPDAIDPALRRAGRFDREIALGIPDTAARERILRVLCERMRLAGDLDLGALAKRCNGFVGADLAALCKEAAVVAVNRIFGDLFGGLLKVQPSARREGFATIPDVTWDEVGALQELRHELHHAIIEPINHPERFEALGLKPSCGVLLHGPPGCGKTLLAKAIANESGASFISVKGPELLNKYVGESERAVRQLFARGRASSPCVVFFDELDALVPRRGGDSSNQASERVVNQMLTEMDGLDGNKQLFVVAATNRPDMIDPAMLRPGRLDKLLYVPLPTPAAREDILRTASRKMPLDASVSLGSIARDRRCEGFSGADLSALAREAAVGALKACTGDTRPVVTSAHFEAAFSHVFPSVSPHEEANYLRAAERLRNARAKTGANTGARAKAEANDMGAAAPAAGGKHADGAD